MKDTLTTTRETIRPPVEDRKRRFRMALASAGLTMSQWARLQDRTPGYVSQVVSGKLESRRMLALIDAFIAKHLRHVA